MHARTTMNDDCILALFDPRSSHGDRRFPVSAWSTNSSPVRVSTLLTVNGSNCIDGQQCRVERPIVTRYNRLIFIHRLKVALHQLEWRGTMAA